MKHHKMKYKNTIKNRKNDKDTKCCSMCFQEIDARAKRCRYCSSFQGVYKLIINTSLLIAFALSVITILNMIYPSLFDFLGFNDSTVIVETIDSSEYDYPSYLFDHKPIKLIIKNVGNRPCLVTGIAAYHIAKQNREYSIGKISLTPYLPITVEAGKTVFVGGELQKETKLWPEIYPLNIRENPEFLYLRIRVSHYSGRTEQFEKNFWECRELLSEFFKNGIFINDELFYNIDDLSMLCRIREIGKKYNEDYKYFNLHDEYLKYYKISDQYIIYKFSGYSIFNYDGPEEKYGNWLMLLPEVCERKIITGQEVSQFMRGVDNPEMYMQKIIDSYECVSAECN